MMANVTNREWFGLALVIALVALASFYRLGEPTLWNDEADTACFARNTLKRGWPVAYAGRNVTVFDKGSSVSAGLSSRRVPWLSFYLAAAGMGALGESTFAARAGFALCGVLTAIPLWLLLRGWVGHPLVATATLLLAPQAILFTRNARYYALLTFLFVTLLAVNYLVRHAEIGKTAALVGLAALLFHTHPLAAAAALLGLVLAEAVFDRGDAKRLGIAAFAGLASWGFWYFPLTAIPSDAPQLPTPWSRPRDWLAMLVDGLVSFLRDFDFVNVLPLAALAIGIALAGIRSPRELKRRLGDRRVIGIALATLAVVAAVSATVGIETAKGLAVLRYAPHVMLLLPVLLLVVWEAAIPRGWATAAFVVFMATNIGAESCWLDAGRYGPARWSWAWTTYAEIAYPPADDMAALLQRLEAAATKQTEPLVRIIPPYLNDVVNFYLGDRVWTVPDVRPGTEADRRVRQAMGADYSRLRQPFDIGVVFGGIRETPDVYTKETIPWHRPTPDATRPELTRHGFANAKQQIVVEILFRGDNNSPHH